MVRKGWSAMDVPWSRCSGGQGHRLKKWPPAKRNAVTESRGQRQGAPRFQQVVSGRGPAPSPEEVIERARVRVAQLEAAVQLLDVEDPAPPLREVSDESSGSSVGTPVDRPDCFVRVVRCPEEEASRASRAGNSGSCTQEGPPQDRGVAGEERLARLKDDLEMSRSSTVPGVSTPSTDLQAEVQKLRVAVAELTRERDIFKAEAEEPARKKFVTGTHTWASLPHPTLAFRGNCTSGWWPDRRI